MEPQKTNKDVMTSDFSTIKTDANLKEAFEGIKKMLEKSPPLTKNCNQGRKSKHARN